MASKSFWCWRRLSTCGAQGMTCRRISTIVYLVWIDKRPKSHLTFKYGREKQECIQVRIKKYNYAMINNIGELSTYTGPVLVSSFLIHVWYLYVFALYRSLYPAETQLFCHLFTLITLRLAIRAQVALLTNLNVNEGLTNGALDHQACTSDVETINSIQPSMQLLGFA